MTKVDERMKYLLICQLLVLHIGKAASSSVSMEGRKVLLVSMDGFRHDYLQRTNTPHFDALIASGVKVPYLNTTFVSSTFPSHTSLLTGLYDESHGIVSNTFYDPLYNSNFSKNLEPKWWNSSEPIWANAVKSGLKVGTFFMPGTETRYRGLLPTQNRKYKKSTPFLDRIETVVGWLSRDDYDFAVLYFHEPDSTGHKYGPEDPRLVPVLGLMDSLLGKLMESLDKAGLKDKVDLIVLSDHGMTTIDPINKVIDITDYATSALLEFAIPSEYYAYMNLMPQPGKAQELVDALKNVEHVNAFLKQDIPERFHYRNNRRILPVFVYADEGWLLTTATREIPSNKMNYGGHGYDNALMSMKSIFMASGPSFKTGFHMSEPIKSVDVYPLMCHLLQLTPAPNNGSLERVMPLLRASSASLLYSFPLSIGVLCLSLASII